MFCTKNILKIIIQCTFFVSVSLRPQNADFQFSDDDSRKYEGSECTTYGGPSGVCQTLENCRYSTSEVTQDDFCSFSKSVPLYCCTVAASTSIQLQKIDELRPVDQICEHYYPRDKPPKVAFVGGAGSKADAHPHMAALGWTNFDGNIDWRCGGSVVTSNFILTAAHCTSSRGNPPAVARTGDLNLLITENNTFPEDFQITDIFVHPEYNAREMYHDIALLKISPDFGSTRGEDILPACIWSNYEIPTAEVLGMGYGTLAFSGPQSNELYEGTLNLQTHEECVQNTPTMPEVPRGIIRSQLCAHDPKNVKDTCQGDSGGPLQFENNVGYSWRPNIVGITSFGRNCAGSTPGVYTRVSEYIDWIESILLTDFHNKTVT